MKLFSSEWTDSQGGGGVVAADTAPILRAAPSVFDQPAALPVSSFEQPVLTLFPTPPVPAEMPTAPQPGQPATPASSAAGDGCTSCAGGGAAAPYSASPQLTATISSGGPQQAVRDVPWWVWLLAALVAVSMLRD